MLIRPPKDAVMSLLTLELETHAIDCCDFHLVKLSLIKYLINWIDFYKRVIPYHDKYIIGIFDEVTKDFGDIIVKINQRFNTNFEVFIHTEKKVKEIHTQLGFHSGPSTKRQSLKRMAIEHFEDEEIKHLLAKAEDIYYRFERLAKANSIRVSKVKTYC